MPQFAVYRNTNAEQSRNIPYLLNVQSDLLDVLQTRVVVPLAVPEVLSGKAAQRLNPTFEVEGRRVVMLTPELAGIPTRLLGSLVMSLEPERERIIAALDFLILGW
jgi:toxin CcdB